MERVQTFLSAYLEEGLREVRAHKKTPRLK